MSASSRVLKRFLSLGFSPNFSKFGVWKEERTHHRLQHNPVDRRRVSSIALQVGISNFKLAAQANHNWFSLQIDSNPSRLQNTFNLNIQVEKLFLIHSNVWRRCAERHSKPHGQRAVWGWISTHSVQEIKKKLQIKDRKCIRLYAISLRIEEHQDALESLHSSLSSCYIRHSRTSLQTWYSIQERFPTLSVALFESTLKYLRIYLKINFASPNCISTFF